MSEATCPKCANNGLRREPGGDVICIVCSYRPVTTPPLDIPAPGAERREARLLTTGRDSYTRTRL